MAGKSANSGDDDFTTMLRSLDREELIQILSSGFCQNCHSNIQSCVRNMVNKKFSTMSLSNGVSSDRNSSQVSESRHTGQNSQISQPTTNTKQPSYSPVDQELSQEQKEQMIRLKQVGRKKDFEHYEWIDGRSINVLKGLELHSRVFDVEEQKKIVEYVYELQRKGQKGQLRPRTYSEPRKWMRGKGRITMQFGCCYNYSVDRNGNPPGILQEEEVDPLPPVFKQMIQRMVRWQVLPSTCVPNSCIVNIYEEGDCIPPHIDHHDFLRPFCTVSFLAECNILFGSRLKTLGPGEFEGPVSISLPVGSVLVLSGNGADIAKHCVPGVPLKRISITFRRMDDRKIPHNFKEDPDLRGLKPLLSTPPTTRFPVTQRTSYDDRRISLQKTINSTYVVPEDEFPPLGGTNNRRTR